ncbi:hypothetical protein Ae263Ps1_6362 [Pseudonocardia sp. Ae263_Ps1]|nr:hypothetical protein Ae263Ps1_6362 [Pseudonocardia sp. Ae263_Ps1]
MARILVREDSRVTEFTDVEFADVGPGEWAGAVAKSFVETVRLYVASSPSDLAVEECWVARDLSLIFMYQLDGDALGGRFADLHICPSTGAPLDPAQRGVSSSSAGGYAFHMFYGVPVCAGVPEIKWTAPDGRRWWGAVPEQGWSAVVAGPRLVSIR